MVKYEYSQKFCYLEVTIPQFEKTPIRVLQGLVLANSHVFTEFVDSEESSKGDFLKIIFFFIDAALMWALEPLGATMYRYTSMLLLELNRYASFVSGMIMIIIIMVILGAISPEST